MRWFVFVFESMGAHKYMCALNFLIQLCDEKNRMYTAHGIRATISNIFQLVIYFSDRHIHGVFQRCTILSGMLDSSDTSS